MSILKLWKSDTSSGSKHHLQLGALKRFSTQFCWVFPTFVLDFPFTCNREKWDALRNTFSGLRLTYASFVYLMCEERGFMSTDQQCTWRDGKKMDFAETSALNAACCQVENTSECGFSLSILSIWTFHSNERFFSSTTLASLPVSDRPTKTHKGWRNAIFTSRI